MNEILSLVLGSMHADLARLDHVAMNLANVQTPGFKREVGLTLPFAARVDRGVQQGLLAGDGVAPESLRALHVDARPGTLKSTGQALDLALAGPGWFEVRTESGAAYTRQGNFRLDARGRIVTPQGHPVMGAGGEIQLVQGKPVIDASGRVFEGDAGPGAQPVGQLRIVQFEPSVRVERLGDGLLLLHGEAAAAPEGSTRVEQGFLENSNVAPMHEMVQLLQSVRHLETMQKVAMGYDEMLGTSIRRLGEPS
ncbi:flagellar basal-body rod protein FlgF [Ramlibacter monticola]|uniref:Flagellar hook-basal body protein n=1 Tax=Ramlibacter monticola TaxID=1926872 RepID=A0A936Z1Y4_9BURK|nr:flagellar hook-basal body protein [Ramlibacter monticola]MBL0393515.1 flagellar hook-basal body protein [Ramlibacter monticola]